MLGFLGRNRILLAVVSLIWLIWRSGSQPRRLAYPCQQAAAANVGVLAILVVPLLARRRAERYGPTRPHLARLATGSVALAGVLFVVISAGVSAYTQYTASFSPGNPAILPWIPADTSIDGEVDRAPLQPNDAHSVVALTRRIGVSYGNEPYNPGTNSVYDLIWQTVVDLQLGPADNPLQNLVADMDGDGVIRAIIKPNTVWYYSITWNDRCPVYSHPATLRPIVDMLATAGVDEIRMGDGSDASGDYFTSKLDLMGFTQDYFDALSALWPGVLIERVDFQNLGHWSWVNLGTGPGGASTYVDSGYTSGDLSKGHASSSYFNQTDPHGQPGPGLAQCMGWLAISDYMFDADVIIDLAKLKVHYLGPHTAVLKNWVGTTMYSTYNNTGQGSSRVSHSADGPSSYENSFGNDMLWREVSDAHRATLYFRDGQIHDTPQRRYLCVLDAVSCAERYHVPNQPIAYRQDTVVAGVDPVAVDAVGARIQRYDFRRIPIVNNAHASSEGAIWPIGTADPGEIQIVGDTGVDTTYNRLAAFEKTFDDDLSWPEWDELTIDDLEPPVIEVAHAVPDGDDWAITVQAAGGHVAFYEFTDPATGATRSVRLARDGDLYTGLADAPDAGRVTVQDAYFNLARAPVYAEPTLWIDVDHIDVDARSGDPAFAETFHVRNIGPGTLNYRIEVPPENADWMSVWPTTGASQGETDRIMAIFNVPAARPGLHASTLTITNVETESVLGLLTVQLEIAGVPGDYDLDEDVDMDDFGRLQRCLDSPGQTPSDPDCLGVSLDADADVDQNDLTAFLACRSGAGVPADPNCASQPEESAEE